MGQLLIVFGAMGWIMALIMLLVGSHRPAMWVSGIVGAVGLLAMLAPLILDRGVFGELGHGDGMGLIGMTMVGALLAVAGLLLMAIAASKAPAKDKNGV